MRKLFAVDYTPQDVQLAKATYLTLARLLGDYADSLVVIGGFVPYLLVPQEGLDADQAHIGTADLDVVLHLGLLDDEAYKTIAELMRESEFEPDTKPETGNRVPQRWVAPGTGGKVIVEFLLPPPEGRRAEMKRGKKRVKNLEGDFAAFLLPGGQFAFADAKRVPIVGRDLRGAEVERSMQVCGPASFLVLKALAHENRDRRKDAYDIGHRPIVGQFQYSVVSQSGAEGARRPSGGAEGGARVSRAVWGETASPPTRKGAPVRTLQDCSAI